MIEVVIAQGKKEQLAKDISEYLKEQNSLDELQQMASDDVLDSLPDSDKKMFQFLKNTLGLDFGAIYNGYCSDITRTICVGKASDNQKKFYNALLEAQLHGLKFIKKGASGKAVDAAVREKLKTYDLEKYFTHGLGHGVGIEIHEEPRLSRLSKCESLQPNMIVTDEPGIYIPNVGGLRIEDTVLVTDGDAETLTNSPKILIEIGG
jgi:Xaa-Pro aminopeptidase